jgi:hypothetical protein
MYEIDCRQVESFEDLIAAFNSGLIEHVGGKWNGNLDALNDYLSWPEPCPCVLVILGREQCVRMLNFKANERHGKNIWPLIEEILASNGEWVHVEYK